MKRRNGSLLVLPDPSSSSASILRPTLIICTLASALPLACGCRSSYAHEFESAAPAGRWTIGPQDGSCHITFAFPPPHNDYSGEVHAAAGWAEMDAHGRMSGQFTVRAADVDMGDPDLTENVRFAAEMLHGGDFPDISFEFKDADTRRAVIADGEGCLGPAAISTDTSPQHALTATLEGVFRLKGVESPLSAPARIHFIPGEGRRFTLRLQGTFDLHDLRQDFHISGPGDENDPAGNTLHFVFDLLLIPAADDLGSNKLHPHLEAKSEI